LRYEFSIRRKFVSVKHPEKAGDGKVLREKLHVLSPNDLQKKGWLLSRILALKNHPDNSLSISQRSVNIRKEARPTRLTFPLDFLEARTISILQKTTTHKPSLPTSTCSNSLIEPFADDAARFGDFCIFSKSRCGQTTTHLGRTKYQIRGKGCGFLARMEGLTTLECQKQTKE